MAAAWSGCSRGDSGELKRFSRGLAGRRQRARNGAIGLAGVGLAGRAGENRRRGLAELPEEVEEASRTLSHRPESLSNQLDDPLHSLYTLRVAILVCCALAIMALASAHHAKCSPPQQVEYPNPHNEQWNLALAKLFNIPYGRPRYRRKVSSTLVGRLTRHARFKAKRDCI